MWRVKFNWGGSVLCTDRLTDISMFVHFGMHTFQCVYISTRILFVVRTFSSLFNSRIISKGPVWSWRAAKHALIFSLFVSDNECVFVVLLCVQWMAGCVVRVVQGLVLWWLVYIERQNGDWQRYVTVWSLGLNWIIYKDPVRTVQ
jgi:hypothetical protein